MPEAEQIDCFRIGDVLKTARRALEAVLAVERKPERGERFDGGVELALARHNGFAESAKLVGLHRVETDGQKRILRRDVEIEQSLILLRARAGDDGADMGVVGMLFP